MLSLALFLLVTRPTFDLGTESEARLERDTVWQARGEQFYDEPIDPDMYLIRPGELLRVTFIGTQLPPLQLAVDAESRIVDQNLGVVDLADRTLSEARGLLTQAMARVYNTGEAAVSVSDPYPVVIRVSGAVNRPGRYRAYLSQRVSDIIDSAGGIAPGGSARRLRFVSPRREVPVDLDQAVMTGDPGADPCLYAGLHVIVPPRSTTVVHVLGAVSNPREIELIGGESLDQLLALAGGPLADADVGSSYLVNDSGRNPLMPGSIRPGDFIMVPTGSAGARAGDVILVGAVARVGRYPYRDGMSLSDLLTLGGGAAKRANLSRVTIFRKAEPDVWSRREAARYPLSPAAEADVDAGAVMLRPSDSVFVPVRLGYVKVSGEVRYPGLYEYRSGKAASYYIGSAGGTTGRAELCTVHLFDRVAEVTGRISLQSAVRDGDEVVVRCSEDRP
ncbi:MAG TPA: SLBB domain-containing protein [Acidobacteriota bacterium]|nr:SLBB domain-containing protein [Acidobacteriota bacterium]